MNSVTSNEGDVALNTSLILQNYGDICDHNLIDMFQFNDDDSLYITKQSLYYDTNGLSNILLKNPKKISLMSINIQSLNSKFTQLQVYLNQNAFDIICIQETWLTDDDNI